ncbi:MAG: hypothetical protein H6867_08450 [Rhodospirillales bacterium]|nr:hypothetical protein [Rhodospirillales bacterium]MCB9995583.1 hypothetical protein [Rhodospirillales bacterium]
MSSTDNAANIKHVKQISSFKNGRLCSLFNAIAPLAAGIGVGIAFKTCALSMLCATALPPAATVMVAAAATGAFMGALGSYWKYRREKKQNPLTKYWNEKTSTRIAVGTVVSMISGGMSYHFGDQIADSISDKLADWFGNSDTPATDLVQQPEIDLVEPETEILPEELEIVAEPETEAIPENVTPEVVSDEPSASAPTTQETVSVEPAPESNDLPPQDPEPELVLVDTDHQDATDIPEPKDVTEATPAVETENMTEITAYDPVQFLTDVAERTADLSGLNTALDQYISDNNITDKTVLALVERAQDGNAQALKDLAAAINTEGKVLCIELPKDNALIGQLYEASISKGNIQAMIDYAYLQNFGQSGFTMDKESAIGLMQHVMDITGENSRLHEIASCFHEQWAEGFNGKDCVGDVVCTSGAEATPVTPPQPEVLPPAVDTPAQPPVEGVVQRNGMGCIPIIDGKDISFLCEVNDNTDALIEGDRIQFNHLMPRL